MSEMKFRLGCIGKLLITKFSSLKESLNDSVKLTANDSYSLALVGSVMTRQDLNTKSLKQVMSEIDNRARNGYYYHILSKSDFDKEQLNFIIESLSSLEYKTFDADIAFSKNTDLIMIYWG